MYRALYDYQSSLPGYLSFKAGDQFTVIEKTSNDWLLAQNGFGQVGFVPHNYISGTKEKSAAVLKFVDGSIEAIHLQAASEGGQYTHDQRDSLHDINKHILQIGVCPSLPVYTAGQMQSTCNGSKTLRNPASHTRKMIKHRSDLAFYFQSRPPLEKSQSMGCTFPTSPKRVAPAPPLSGALRQLSEIRTFAESASKEGLQDEKTSPVSDRNESPEFPPPPSPTSEAADFSYHSAQLGKDAILESSVKEDLLNQSNTDSPNKTSQSVTQVTSEGDLPKSASKPLDVFSVPEKIGPELLEEVRRNTGLSYEKSKIAVETVLGYVGFKIPELEMVMDHILTTFRIERDISDEDIISHDAQRLTVIFEELTACKEDSQQRSWALHEDEAVIYEYLEELLSILENAKPSICRKVIARDNYDILHSLVQYYQMETRAVLCRSLLKVFGAVCGLHQDALRHLLYSVLPLELAQEMLQYTYDVQRMSYTALLMTMLFSTEEQPTTATTDQLNKEFFQQILHLIEEPPSVQFEDKVVDQLVSFMLSFNLHHYDNSKNAILQALASYSTPKVFTEHLMVLINRGGDPVRMFEYMPQPQNSVLKLFHNLYSSPATSDLLYTNDAKVLIDVIVGRLSNLCSGDATRTSFLELCYLVLRNSSYTEHKHRLKELFCCLEAIQEEEADTEDRPIARKILDEHKDLFL